MIRNLKIVFFIFYCSCFYLSAASEQVSLWHKLELDFESKKEYENALYNVGEFSVTFISPTGRERRVNGFWDGARDWKARFQPDEVGLWSWTSTCSDQENKGLHGLDGSFVCERRDETLELFQRGAIQHSPGSYHLSYADGAPFFWMACTTWNGAMKSTEKEWDHYLDDRRDRNFSAIQFVTTQWRGGDSNRSGEVAFTGSGRIEVNPAFFKELDERIDRINEFGLVASPVLLWALPSVTGRHLSPGYYLPVDEASKLASYIVARYQGNHVVWSLGGDGRYFGHFEGRWKAIGDAVFGDIDHALATLHPHGQSYVGDLYAGKSWYGLMSYQSSHNYTQNVVDFINRQEVANNWSLLRPMPHINMEPLYENIHDHQTSENVRNAIWWSLFATPVAGITYGANGIWSWIGKDGDQILNHRTAPWTVSWKNSLKLPVSREMEYVHDFMSRLDWWELYPNSELLVEQPGDNAYDAFVGTLAKRDRSLILLYVPKNGTVSVRIARDMDYSGAWFNPTSNEYESAVLDRGDGVLSATKNADTGMVLILKQAKQ